MNVQRTVRLRLKPSPEQRRLLLATLEQSTAYFNAVAAYGWQHGQRNSVELHKATYYQLPTSCVASIRVCRPNW